MYCYSYIPWEIVIDILTRLPAKSLLRFRCVSTSWLRLIDSSGFVKSHLNRAAIRNNINDLSLVLTDTRHRLHAVGFDSIVNNNNVKVVPLVHPEVQPYKHRVCGSCNGLVCLTAAEVGIPSLVLWNPSTRKLRKLPHRALACPFRGQVYMTYGYGFGYDHVNDDYKVVRITIVAADNSLENKLADEVDVYSLNSNSWRTVEKPPHNVHLRCSDLKKGELAGGAIHWADFGRPYSAQIQRIIAFDLVTEEYRFVPLSEHLDSDHPTSLKSFKGCLSVICIDFVKDFNFAVDIWVMKDYGIKESWTKLITFAYPLPFRTAVSLFPLAYSDDRSEILLHDKHDDNKLVWFSLEGKKLDKTVGIDGITDVCDFDTCIGSLVSINESCNTNRQTEELKKAKLVEEDLPTQRTIKDIRKNDQGQNYAYVNMQNDMGVGMESGHGDLFS